MVLGSGSAAVLIPWPVIALPLVLLVFWAYCLYDFAHTDEVDMRTHSRGVWLLLLVFTGVVGGTLWLVCGRPSQPRDRSSIH